MSFGAKLLLGLVAALVIVLMINGSCDSTPSSATHFTSTSAPSNDAELLIFRCGKPDVDDSTAYDNPRPPIPTRLITYNKAHLKFAYFPGGSGRTGDPPPYQWKFMGIVDTRTNKALTADNLKAVLSSRLPCAIAK